MIKVFLIIMGCAEPNYTECHELDPVEQPNMLTCQLRRPAVTSIFHAMPGWRIFTKCQYVNPDKNGKLG